MKLRSVDIQRLLEICPGLENRLSGQFDDMLWELMQCGAENIHLCLEPKFSCLVPNLPNFHPLEEDEGGDLYELKGDTYVKTPRKSETREEKMKEGSSYMTKFFSYFQTSVDETKAKGETFLWKFNFFDRKHSLIFTLHGPELLRERGRQQAEQDRGEHQESRQQNAAGGNLSEEQPTPHGRQWHLAVGESGGPVSYTHLTLPTKA